MTILKHTTIRVNNIIFAIGNKYLYKIENSCLIHEHLERKAIVKKLGYKNLLSLLEDKDLTDAEKWRTFARIYDNEMFC